MQHPGHCEDEHTTCFQLWSGRLIHSIWGVSINRGTQKRRVYMRETPIKMDDVGLIPLTETARCLYDFVWTWCSYSDPHHSPNGVSIATATRKITIGFLRSTAINFQFAEMNIPFFRSLKEKHPETPWFFVGNFPHWDHTMGGWQWPQNDLLGPKKTRPASWQQKTWDASKFRGQQNSWNSWNSCWEFLSEQLV